MDLLIVDRDNCINCSVCAEICPSYIIEIRENLPYIISDQHCIRCGHCVAVCPTGALDHIYAPLDAQVPISIDLLPRASEATHFLRSRRSIRCYKQQPIPQEDLKELLDIARFAPTAINIQGISYLVISNQEKLKHIAMVTVDWMVEEMTKGSSLTIYQNYIENFRQGKDVILRGAPHLIVATAPKSIRVLSRDNARFTLEYVELMATIWGIGTCWAGLVQACAFSKYQPLLEILDLHEDKVVAGALMAGYPKYQYRRLVDRNPLEVSWA